MLYNIQLQKLRTITDCFSCPAYNKELKICEGIGKICIEWGEDISAVTGEEKGEEKHEEE